MINSVFIVMLSAFSGLMIGLALSRRDRERELYYKDIVKLCSVMSNNISFKSDKIISVIETAEFESKALKKNLSEYKQYLNGGQLKLTDNCLNKAETARVRQFLNELGRYDGETQLNELSRTEGEFKLKYNELKEKNNKQGNMFIKLGLLFGALIGILLI